VFCGSSAGNKVSYKDAAIELGTELVSRNIDLVYGGGSIGLMGLISQAVFNGGRHCHWGYPQDTNAKRDNRRDSGRSEGSSRHAPKES